MTVGIQEATASTWSIDPSHSEVGFSIKHMMITTVRGAFSDVSGTIKLDPTDVRKSSVQVQIGAASIDTRTADRDNHLRSGDFLDVEAFPYIRFESKRIEGSFPQPGATFQLIGDLTIRDTTREVTLDVEYEGRGEDPWGGERVGFTAETRIDRRDFGLTWNQALETGGVLVANNLKVSLSVQAVLDSETSNA